MVDPPQSLADASSDEPASVSNVDERSRGQRAPRRRRLLLAISVCALIALGSGAALLASTGGGRSSGSTTAHAEFGRADQLRLGAALASQDPTSFKAALAPALQSALGDPRNSMLPPGSTVSFVPTTFNQRGGVATITADVRGPQRGHFKVLLTREGERWLVLGTQRSSP